jgi:hypothetical protein
MFNRTATGRVLLMLRTSLGWAIISLLGLLLSSCGENGEDAPLPPPPHAVQVQMREYGFRYDRSIGPGRTVFRVRNTGRLSHELVLIPLSKNFPPIDVQLRSKTRQLIAPFARLELVRAGRSGTFAVDLAPGRYAMVSFIKDRKGMSDALKGMTSEFRVR